MTLPDDPNRPPPMPPGPPPGGPRPGPPGGHPGTGPPPRGSGGPTPYAPGGPAPQGPRRDRRRPLVAGLVAVTAVIALVAVGLVVLDPFDEAGAPPGPTPAAAPATQGLERVGHITPARPPKDEGYPTAPGPELTRIHDGVAYTAFHTARSISFTAYGLDAAAVVWERTLRVPENSIASIRFEVVDGALVLETQYPDGFVITLGLNRDTGETMWTLPQRVGCESGCHYGDRLIAYDHDPNQQNAFDVRTGQQVWSAPERTDEPSFTWIPQETAESLAAPGDPQDHPQRRVGHGQKATGTTKIIDTASGRIIGEGVLGEKVMSYVLLDDVLYVYRQTPRDLKAYAVTDLDTPLWTQALPAAQDGSALVACDETTLCLTLVQGATRTLRAIDTATGTTRWETGEHPLTAPYDIRSVGGPIAVTTRDSTMLLDRGSGAVLETFAAPDYTFAGAGLLVLTTPDGPVAYDAARRAPADLGPELGRGVDRDTCVWAEKYVTCADPDADDWEVTFWRYGG